MPVEDKEIPVLMEPSSRARRGYGLMLSSVLLFSANALVVKAGGAHLGVNGWEVSFFRSWVGLAILFLLFYRSGRFQPLHLVTNRWLVLRGVVGSLAILIFYSTVILIDVGRATVLGCTYPLFATLFAVVMLKETFRPGQLAWMALALAGVALITGLFQQAWVFNPYEALCLFGAVLAGFVVVVIRKLHSSEHTSTIFGAQCFYGLFVTAPVALGTLLALSPAAFGVLVLAGILVAFGQLTMTGAYKDLPVAKGASTQLLLPVLNALGGMMFFGESYSGLEFLGGALVVYSCYRIIRMRSVSV